jgi:hypothetical protein
MNRDLLAAILRTLRWMLVMMLIIALVDALALIPWFMTGHAAVLPWKQG